MNAEGLQRLDECLRDITDTLIVAPDRERSAVSHGLTIRSSLELNRLDSHRFTLNGTPADCVIYALKSLMTAPPDLVISGINHGANLADDIMYSGTVAAAREASRHGIPALAVSQAYDEKPIRFDRGMRFTRVLVETLLAKKPKPGICLNINIPVGSIRGVRITRQGCTLHFPHFNSLYLDGNGEEAGRNPFDLRKPELQLDFQAVVDHFVSITPLQRDQTDYLLAQSLHEEVPRLMQPRRFARMGLIRHKK